MTVDYNGVESTVVDGAGNPQPTADDVYLDKDINEKFRMGLTNTFTWKDFTLSATLDYRYGGYIFSYTKDYMHWVVVVLKQFITTEIHLLCQIR
jgi:maltose-binding protein MalE